MLHKSTFHRGKGPYERPQKGRYLESDWTTLSLSSPLRGKRRCARRPLSSCQSWSRVEETVLLRQLCAAFVNKLTVASCFCHKQTNEPPTLLFEKRLTDKGQEGELFKMDLRFGTWNPSSPAAVQSYKNNHQNLQNQGTWLNTRRNPCFHKKSPIKPLFCCQFHSLCQCFWNLCASVHVYDFFSLCLIFQRPPMVHY